MVDEKLNPSEVAFQSIRKVLRQILSCKVKDSRSSYHLRVEIKLIKHLDRFAIIIFASYGESVVPIIVMSQATM